MITRVSNKNDINLDKVARIVNEQENLKLFDTVTDKQLNITVKELELQGYKVKVDIVKPNVNNIYIVKQKKIPIKEAKLSGNFKKLAWGKYQYIIGSTNKFGFDEGSIWTVIKDDDGNEYLVKETSDDEEEKIIRCASLINNPKELLNKLYKNNEVLNDIDDNKILNDILNNKITKICKNINANCTNAELKKNKNKIINILKDANFNNNIDIYSLLK